MFFMGVFSKKGIEFAVLFGLLCAVLMSFSRFDAACGDLRQSVLRLHILANSDSEADQRVKLLVRDRILAETGGLFEQSGDLDAALRAARKATGQFTEIANEVLAENGFSYQAGASVGKSYFETRKYRDFTLPAGTYQSLIIRLGAAKGHNWWCVVFPAVCVPAVSSADLSDSASAVGAGVAEHPDRYVMRFKTVEWYEDIKEKLAKK